jgi:hypothetical protein
LGRKASKSLSATFLKTGMLDHDISILVTTAYDNFSVFVLAEGKILVEDIV